MTEIFRLTIEPLYEKGGPWLERFFSTYDKAKAGLAIWCCENWENEPQSSGVSIPADDFDVIKLWFLQSSDRFTIEAVEVDGGDVMK